MFRNSEGRTAVLPKGYSVARRRRPPPPATAAPPEGRVYVLWRHQYDDFEILGVFTTPEKFQAYVAKRFPKTQVGSRWRTGDGEWLMSTPQSIVRVEVCRTFYL